MKWYQEKRSELGDVFSNETQLPPSIKKVKWLKHFWFKKNKKKGSGISAGDLLGIALVAAAAGLVTGMLFAPQSGAKTRKVLNTAIKESVDRFKFVMLEARVMSEELVEKGIGKADKISSKIRSKK